jgi:formate-dependent nitrite reductase membrane component NrfD
MCLLFVMADVGRPDHLWHMIPVIGYINFPRSLLAWDMVVLNAYFAVNFVVVTHILYRAFTGRHYAKKLVVPPYAKKAAARAFKITLSPAVACPTNLVMPPVPKSVVAPPFS